MGDNHLVVQTICSEIGLSTRGVMQGYEMDIVTDEALRKRVLNTTILTRFSPDQKNRVILALKANHRAVGYLVDGINDAPSLKAADIGITVNTQRMLPKRPPIYAYRKTSIITCLFLVLPALFFVI